MTYELKTSFAGNHALMCGEINPRFKDYMVKTTHEEIKDMIEGFQRDPVPLVLHVFSSTYRSLTQYTDEEVSDHYNNQTQEWRDWCNDVALFYAARLVLLKKYIPITQIPETAEIH